MALTNQCFKDKKFYEHGRLGHFGHDACTKKSMKMARGLAGKPDSPVYETYQTRQDIG